MAPGTWRGRKIERRKTVTVTKKEKNQLDEDKKTQLGEEKKGKTKLATHTPEGHFISSNQLSLAHAIWESDKPGDPYDRRVFHQFRWGYLVRERLEHLDLRVTYE
jgi:hypothetical protein